jgi:hypothetical protein
MERNRIIKKGLDIAIFLCAVFLCLCFYYLDNGQAWMRTLMVIAVGVGLLAMVDLVVQISSFKTPVDKAPINYLEASMARQLVLLDEHDKPLKSWELAGETALVIGKKCNHKDEDVDVDLNDCEYSTFIDCQHAVLNYCMDSWYLEDLNSKNGVKIKKVEDGGCYQVMNRPCRLTMGDIIYIANTRLLLT